MATYCLIRYCKVDAAAAGKLNLIQITLLQLHKEMRTSQTITDVSSICSLIFHERMHSAMWWNTRKKKLMLPFIEQFLMQSQIGKSGVSSYPWTAIKVQWTLISRERSVPKRSNINRHVNNSYFFKNTILMYFCILEEEKHSLCYNVVADTSIISK